jgi:hypothetical protein
MESVRLLYVSKLVNQDSNVKNTLMNILNEAIDFNYKHEIKGVLYYGHGYFVQCLEGKKSAIDNLFYKKILKDSRHMNCEILYYINCDVNFFSQWTMKFLPVNKKITEFFMTNHLDEFNPYLLTAETTVSFVSLLAGEPDIDVNEYTE